MAPPDPWKSIEELFTRIRRLENTPFDSLALQFDKDNEGGYLDITTNDIDADGLGFDINNQSAGGAKIQSKNALLLSGSNSGAFINLGNTANEIDVGGDLWEFDVPSITATGTVFALKGLDTSGTSYWSGALPSGPPVSGTFVTGAWITTDDGHIWICTVGGTSGTWVDVGGGGGGLTAWGEAATAQFVGSGSPVGVVTPSGEGDLYVDNTTPGLWQATGVADTDWQQIGAGSGIAFGIINTGNYLNVETTSDDGSWAIQLHDTGAGGAGVLVASDNGPVELQAATLVEFTSGDNSLEIEAGFGIAAQVGASETIGNYLGTMAVFLIVDSANNPMFQMTEGSPDIHIKTGGAVIADL